MQRAFPVAHRLGLVLTLVSAAVPMIGSAQMRPATVPVIGGASPAPPTNVLVKTTGGVVEIRYQAAPGAATHLVSRRLPGGDWVNLPDVWKTGLYVDAGAEDVFPAQTITYRVSAVYRTAVRSVVAHSEPVAWTRPAPPVVQGLTGVLDNSAKVVKLSWNGAPEDVNIYRGGAQLASTHGTSYFDWQPPSGTHTYHVARRVQVLTSPGELASRVFVIYPEDLSKQASVEVVVP